MHILPGHSWTLQLSVIESSPSHSFPPWAADVFSSLILVRVPPPHVLEHSLICQSSHSQWTKFKLNQYFSNFYFNLINAHYGVMNNLKRKIPSHSCTLHSLVWLGCPVHVPPLASSTNLVLVSTLVPVPHVLEHSPCVHSSQMQWMAKPQETYINRLFLLTSMLNPLYSKIVFKICYKDNTWAIIGVACFLSFSFIRITYPSVFFFNFFSSGINSSSSSTGYRTDS